MTDFAEFYQQGGVFMHLVTLLCLAAAGLLAGRAVRIRDLVRRVQTAQPPPSPPHEGMLTGLVVSALLFGGLGTTAGLMEACAALQTIPVEHHNSAILRAVPVALTTAAWAMLLAAPIALGRAVISAIETRLRRLMPTG